MPYDNDGTVVGYGDAVGSSTAYAIGLGVKYYLSSGDRIEFNTSTYANLSVSLSVSTASFSAQGYRGLWFFFPEQREITGAYYGCASPGTYGAGNGGVTSLEGSNDTTNGVDGTWETATWPSGQAYGDQPSVDGWRKGIKSVSFTGPKRVVRMGISAGSVMGSLVMVHLYGQKAAGQTPDDILYLDGNNAYAEFTAPMDFGDRPLSTTQTWPFKVKNGSATKTANSINLQCNDADFAISSDGSTWVTTLNIASLAAGASSGVMYVRNTTPAAGGAIGPRFARVVATVGSWT